MTVVKIKERNEILHIYYEDVRKYHGNVALMAIAVGYKMVALGLKELYQDEVPNRNAISIEAGHSGPGFRDAFEFITRAFTRGVYHINVEYPVAQYDPYRKQSYAFVIKDCNGPAVEVSLKPHFLPHEFYLIMHKMRENEATQAEVDRYEQLKFELGQQALAMEENELLEVRRLS